MPAEPAPANEPVDDKEINPIAAISEKQKTLETLINQGLAVPVYAITKDRVRVSAIKPVGEEITDVKRTPLNTRELIGAIIQISDNEVISTKFGDLQMQVLSIKGEQIRDKTSKFHKLQNTREVDIDAVSYILS